MGKESILVWGSEKVPLVKEGISGPGGGIERLHHNDQSPNPSHPNLQEPGGERTPGSLSGLRQGPGPLAPLSLSTKPDELCPDSASFFFPTLSGICEERPAALLEVGERGCQS